MIKLEELKSEILKCSKCSIGCQQIDGKVSNVFSNMGQSKIMVVGQNPGATEVRLGLPFVGPSGAFFDKAISEVLKIDRSKLYITNTVKCFTPGNREPSPDEIQNCQSWLEREIEIVNPSIVVTLGNPALKQITGYPSIGKMHGQIIFSLRYKRNVLPLYHPSPLNTNRPKIRAEFLKDLELLREFL